MSILLKNHRKHPEFKKQLNALHPKLASYMGLAMEAFAEHELI